MKILLICGSLRSTSFNMELAQDAKKALEAMDIKSRILPYGDLPLFNQDLEAPELESVSRIRQEIREADGLWFFTPEYNGMITGVLKNLLDWMSRTTAPDYTRASSVLYGKSAAISGAGGRMAAKGSREQLAILLKRLGVKVCPEEYGLALTPEEFSTDSFTDPDSVAEAIASQAREFIAWLKG